MCVGCVCMCTQREREGERGVWTKLGWDILPSLMALTSVTRWDSAATELDSDARVFPRGGSCRAARLPPRQSGHQEQAFQAPASGNCQFLEAWAWTLAQHHVFSALLARAIPEPAETGNIDPPLDGRRSGSLLNLPLVPYQRSFLHVRWKTLTFIAVNGSLEFFQICFPGKSLELRDSTNLSVSGSLISLSISIYVFHCISYI